jgi:hypothetical protein
LGPISVPGQEITSNQLPSAPLSSFSIFQQDQFSEVQQRYPSGADPNR